MKLGNAVALSGLAALVSVSSLVAAQSNSNNTAQQQNPTAIQAPQQQTYEIVIRISDTYDVDITNYLPGALHVEDVDKEVWYRDRQVTIRKSPEGIRETVQKLFQFKEMPDVSHVHTALEELALELSKNPNYLAGFTFGGAFAEDDGIIHVLSYRSKKEDNNIKTDMELQFRGILREDGSVQVVQLTGYEGNLRTVDNSYNGTISSDVNYEEAYGGNYGGDTLNRKVIKIKPANKDDKLTLRAVDVFGHRRSLEDGIRKQDLRFTPDWKPITK